MFLRKSISNNRVYLSFVQGYRDENGKVKQKTIQKLGYLDDLKKEFDDPIAYFKEIARQKSKEEINECTIKNINTKIIEEEDFRKNLGYVILKKIYNELDISSFLNSKNKNLQIDYKLDDIFKLLVFSKLLYPNEKLSFSQNKNAFFEPFDFSKQELYCAFNYLSAYKDELLMILKDKYKTNSTVSYYYFLKTENQLSMEFVLDKNFLPIYYNLIEEGKEPDLKEIKAKLGIERLVIVADNCQNKSDFFEGYIASQQIDELDEEFKKWLLKQDDFIYDKMYDGRGSLITYSKMLRDSSGKIIGYEEKPVIFKHKSRILKINNVYQKQVIYYSQKYADKQSKFRNKIIKEEKYDGYYVLVTSEKNLTDKEINDIYNENSKIEKHFNILCCSSMESIKTQFLVSFIALLIIRLLKKKLNYQYSSTDIKESLKNYNSIRIEHDLYLQDFRNDVIEDIERVFNIDLSRKYLTLSEIKQFLNF